MNVTREELAWAAGFFDGEGNIVAYHSVRCTVTNTHLLTLKWFQNRFGGGIYPLSRHLPAHRPAWQWILSGPAARRWLSLMLPWLHEKAAQAEIARGMLFYPGNAHLTMEQRWQRQLESAELSRLKKVRS